MKWLTARLEILQRKSDDEDLKRNRLTQKVHLPHKVGIVEQGQTKPEATEARTSKNVESGTAAAVTYEASSADSFTFTPYEQVSLMDVGNSLLTVVFSRRNSRPPQYIFEYTLFEVSRICSAQDKFEVPLCIPDPEDWFILLVWAPGITDETTEQLQNIPNIIPGFTVLVSTYSPMPYSLPINKDWAVQVSQRNPADGTFPIAAISFTVADWVRSENGKYFAVMAAHCVKSKEERREIISHNTEQGYRNMKRVSKRAFNRIVANNKIAMKHARSYYRKIAKKAVDERPKERLFADVAILPIDPDDISRLGIGIRALNAQPFSATELSLSRYQ